MCEFAERTFSYRNNKFQQFRNDLAEEFVTGRKLEEPVFFDANLSGTGNHYYFLGAKNSAGALINVV